MKNYGIEGSIARNTKHATPYYVFRAPTEGNTIMITAGIHGNERASIRAAEQLVTSLRSGNLKLHTGKLIIIPRAHRQAILQGKRGVPDLNRTFPRSMGDTSRHPVSAGIVQLARLHKPSWYIDMHEANGLSRVQRHVIGQSLLTDGRSKLIRCAHRVVHSMNRTISQHAYRFTVKVRSRSGTGRTAAFRLWKAQAFTIETCWSLPFSLRVQHQSLMLRELIRLAHVRLH